MDVEQRGFGGDAVGSVVVDSDGGDMGMEMDMDDLCAGLNEMDIDDEDTEMSDDDSCPSTPSTTYSTWSSQAPPSTPQSTFSQASFSTPKTSGSSFSETVAQTPTPANNADAPMPDFSAAGIYSSRHAAAPGTPPKNGAIPFKMESQPANPVQQPAAQQSTAQPQQPHTQQGPARQPSVHQPTTQQPQYAAQQGLAHPQQPTTQQSTTQQPQAQQGPAQQPAAHQPAAQQNQAQPSPTLPPLPPLPAAWQARRHSLKPFEPLEQITHGLASFHISDPATHNWTGAGTFAPYTGRADGAAFEAKIATPGMDALIASMESFHPWTEPGEEQDYRAEPAAPYDIRMPRRTPFMFDLAHWPVVFYLARHMTGPWFHVTKEKDQNWTAPTVFGSFVGKRESEGFEVRWKAAAAAFAAGRAAPVQYVDKGKGVAALPDSTGEGAAVAAEQPRSTDKGKGFAAPEESYEVGSDEDPNVDLNFDFAKVFRPRGRASGKGKGVAAGRQPKSADKGKGVAPQPAPTGKGKGIAADPQSTGKGKATSRATRIVYDYGYANAMMDQMYYSTLPRLAVEFDSRDKPWYTEDRREDDVHDLKAKMDRNDLNDTSFNTVDEAYLERPTLDRIQLYDLFDDWWTEDMNDHLSRIFRGWSEDTLVEFGNALRATFYAYMDDRPPATEDDN